MRYNLNVSGRQYRLIRASIVNFQRSLTISEQGDFDELIDENLFKFRLSFLAIIQTRSIFEKLNLVTIVSRWFQISMLKTARPEISPVKKTPNCV